MQIPFIRIKTKKNVTFNKFTNNDIPTMYQRKIPLDNLIKYNVINLIKRTLRYSIHTYNTTLDSINNILNKLDKLNKLNKLDKLKRLISTLIKHSTYIVNAELDKSKYDALKKKHCNNIQLIRLYKDYNIQISDDLCTIPTIPTIPTIQDTTNKINFIKLNNTDMPIQYQQITINSLEIKNIEQSHITLITKSNNIKKYITEFNKQLDNINEELNKSDTILDIESKIYTDLFNTLLVYTECIRNEYMKYSVYMSASSNNNHYVIFLIKTYNDNVKLIEDYFDVHTNSRHINARPNVLNNQPVNTNSRQINARPNVLNNQSVNTNSRHINARPNVLNNQHSTELRNKRVYASPINPIKLGGKPKPKSKATKPKSTKPKSKTTKPKTKIIKPKTKIIKPKTTKTKVTKSK
jgi:hypothetical protein